MNSRRLNAVFSRFLCRKKKLPKCIIPKYHYEYLNTIAYTNELKNVAEGNKVLDSYYPQFGVDVPSDSSDDDLDNDLDDNLDEEKECNGEQSKDDSAVSEDEYADERDEFKGAIAQIPFETTKKFQKFKKQFKIPFEKN